MGKVVVSSCDAVSVPSLNTKLPLLPRATGGVIGSCGQKGSGFGQNGDHSGFGDLGWEPVFHVEGVADGLTRTHAAFVGTDCDLQRRLNRDTHLWS